MDQNTYRCFNIIFHVSILSFIRVKFKELRQAASPNLFFLTNASPTC